MYWTYFADMMKNLYEVVRSERNVYSKQLIEAQEEITGMRRKFKVMNHQIEQLKEEIQSKDTRMRSSFCASNHLYASRIGETSF